MFLAQGEAEEAYAAFQKAVALDAGRVEVHRYLAQTAARLQRFDEARPVLEQYLAARPEDAIGHTNLGVVYARLGKQQAAVAQLERAVQLDPEYPKAWMQLGLAYETAARNWEAQRAFERVLSFWPRYRPARQRLRALEKRGEGAAAPQAVPR